MRGLLTVAAVAVALLVRSCSGSPIPVTVSANPDGSYAILNGAKDVLLSSGRLSLHTGGNWLHSVDNLTCSAVNHSTGSSPLGPTSTTTFEWGASSEVALAKFYLSVTTFTQAPGLVLFNQSFPGGVAGTAAPETSDPACAFPNFNLSTGMLPSSGFASMSGLSFDVAPPPGRVTASGGPYGAGSRLPFAVVYTPHTKGPDGAMTTTAVATAPLTNQLVASSAGGVGDRSWKHGVQASIPSFPPGFSHATLAFFATSVTEAAYTLGKDYRASFPSNQALHEAALKSDKMVNRVGAWTDNGSWLNMNKFIANGNLKPPYNPLDPATSPAKLSADLVTGLHAMGIPVAYIQLDDWYYRGKVTLGAVSCVDDWDDARPDWFPEGLKGLSEAMNGNTSILGYIPWICSSSKYFTEQGGRFGRIEAGDPKPSGIPGHGGGISKPCPWPSDPTQACAAANSVPLPNQSEAFYNRLFDSVVPKGVTMFEQDFTGGQTGGYGFPTSLTAAADWLQGQERAARSHGMTMQHCLPSSSSLMLAAASLPSVTNARASGDYAGCTGFDIGGSGIVHDVFGVRPFHDTLWTRTHEPGDPYTNTTHTPGAYRHCLNDPDYGQPNVELDVVVAALSSGPLGIGDKPGVTDAGLVMEAIRTDGVILRPDRHATPAELMFGPSPATAAPGPGDALQPNVTRFNLASTTIAVGDSRRLTSYTALAIDFPSSIGATFSPFSGAAYPTPEGGSASSFYAVDWRSTCSAGDAVGAPGSCLRQLVSDSDPLVVSTEPGQVNPTNASHPFRVTTFAAVDSASGWALLGEEGKIVRLSNDRVASFNPPSVHITGKPGETVTMAAVGPSKKVVVATGEVGADGTAVLAFSS